MNRDTTLYAHVHVIYIYGHIRVLLFLRILGLVQIGSRVFSGTSMAPEGIRRYTLTRIHTSITKCMYIANRVCYNNRENEWRSSRFLLANASRPRSFSRPLRGFVLSSMISVQPQCNPELFDAFHRIISICYTFL